MQILNGTCLYNFHVFRKQSERIKLTDFRFFLSNFQQLQKTKSKKAYFLETKTGSSAKIAKNRKETSAVNVKTFEGSFVQSKN